MNKAEYGITSLSAKTIKQKIPDFHELDEAQPQTSGLKMNEKGNSEPLLQSSSQF